ncbi:S8 family serine peptidase [Deinococcus yavapaiensis]|uniref:Serine protease AprX n=1 Tax=Deinococcus yavapaiensis KR-236 TaxID=694435 RepID=A0A318SBH8_9DEIO|nr:S8 family serine peptidase [Deinococcus yavapaiensis]PYE53649.1 serine protease AprX [Deinococcus yavapaiensis KR-236]
MKQRNALGISLLGTSLLLASCGQGNLPSATSARATATAQATTLTECQALYATARTGGPEIQSGMKYGSVGTLILSFADDATKGQAIPWMDANLPVDLGKGLGAFQNLPMIALKTVVTPELIQKLSANLPGLVSIYQDAPLHYLLAQSAKFIGADTARATYGVSGKGVGVAVLDSGIDGTHPDLKNVAKNVKIVGPIVDVGVGGYLTVDTPNSDTSSGHGTHVASTIGGSGAASSDPNKRVGMAPDATLVGIGSGEALSILYALQGFDFALKPDIKDTYNIRVISNSWGSSGEFAPYNPISLAAKRAYDQGVIVTFAAGNEGPDANTLNPYSASPCVISVAAGDKQGYLADFSSRGRPGDALVHPDVTAPGVDISAARATLGLAATTVPDVDNPLYSTISGTSMATPHVSGVIALMLEANPKLTLEGVLAIFKKTSRPMYYVAQSTNGLDPNQVVVKKRELWEVGYGYINANAAVKEAVAQNPVRYSLTTTALPSWSGTVNPAVCAPTVNCVVNAQDQHIVSVPSGATALRIKTDWGNPAFDLDLDVYAPNGSLIASSGQSTSTFEEVNIPNPAAGNYKVVLKGYANLTTPYNGTAEIDKLVLR